MIYYLILVAISAQASSPAGLWFNGDDRFCPAVVEINKKSKIFCPYSAKLIGQVRLGLLLSDKVNK